MVGRVNLLNIQKARTLGRYRLGSYEAIILDNIRSKNPTHYHYILSLYQDGVEDPVFFVTSEAATTPVEGAVINPTLCTYEGDRRTEGDISALWADRAQFFPHAFRIAAEKYNLPAALEPGGEYYNPVPARVGKRPLLTIAIVSTLFVGWILMILGMGYPAMDTSLALLLLFRLTLREIRMEELKIQPWQAARRATNWLGVAFIIIGITGIAWGVIVLPSLPLIFPIGFLLIGVSFLLLGQNRAVILKVDATWRFVLFCIIGGLSIITNFIIASEFSNSLLYFFGLVATLLCGITSFIQSRRGSKNP